MTESRADSNGMSDIEHARRTAVARFDVLMRRRARLLVGLSATIYASCLPFDAYRTAWSDDSAMNGFGLLLIGWLGVLGGYFEWLANPLLLATWVSLWIRKPQHAIFFGVLASFVAIAFIFRDKMLVNEAGHTARITFLGVGYWLWVVSILTAFVCSIVLTVQSRRRYTF
jgi:hypothetical protein